MILLRIVYGFFGLIFGYLVTIHFCVIPKIIVFMFSISVFFILLALEESSRQSFEQEDLIKIPPTYLVWGMFLGIIIGYIVLNGINFDTKLDFLKELFIPK